MQTLNSWGLALSWAVIHYPFMFSFRNTTSRETWPQGNLFQECVWPPSQQAGTVLPPLLVCSHHPPARWSQAITPTLPTANGKIFMHLMAINTQIVAVKWLSQGWGGSLWQSRVPGALCACLNTAVISAGRVGLPTPQQWPGYGTVRRCVCVCWFFHGEHQDKISIMSPEQRHGCCVPLRVRGGVGHGGSKAVSSCPWQVGACRHGGSFCGFVWLFVEKKMGENQLYGCL